MSLLFPCTLESACERLLVDVIFNDVVVVTFAWALFGAHDFVNELGIHGFGNFGASLTLEAWEFGVAHLVLVV